MAVFSDEQFIIINQFISNRKLISRPVLRTALHDILRTRNEASSQSPYTDEDGQEENVRHLMQSS